MSIPFPTPPVRILGQPLEVYGYSIVASARCACDSHAPVQLVSQLTAGGLCSVPSSCVSCGRIYAVQGVTTDHNGMLRFSISCNEPSTPMLVS